MANFVKGALRLSQNAARSNQLVIAKRNYDFPIWIRKHMYNLSGWNQYGLYKDDLMVENPDVREAIRRLPPNLQDERAFRIQRATQLSLMKTVLPKDQWPSFEEDVEKGRYLKPYLDEVKREKAEQAFWDKR